MWRAFHIRQALDNGSISFGFRLCRALEFGTWETWTAHLNSVRKHLKRGPRQPRHGKCLILEILLCFCLYSYLYLYLHLHSPLRCHARRCLGYLFYEFMPHWRARFIASLSSECGLALSFHSHSHVHTHSHTHGSVLTAWKRGFPLCH